MELAVGSCHLKALYAVERINAAVGIREFHNHLIAVDRQTLECWVLRDKPLYAVRVGEGTISKALAHLTFLRGMNLLHLPCVGTVVVADKSTVLYQL